jgi:prephenate dehydrogenase
VQFRKIALVGIGLLGGSLALAIRERQLAAIVQGYVRREASIIECEQMGLSDLATADLSGAVGDADLVFLCTPLAQMKTLVERMLPALKRGAIVSDVGSVAELEGMISRAGAHFIGAHPMAGAEKMGVLAARVDLFRNAVCVLTPTKNSSADALQKLEDFWRTLGARLLKLSPQVHDELVARCSHLPHVVAAELANYVLDPNHPKEQPMLCANGFRDTTRIAASSPEMWRDIALANAGHLSDALNVFIGDLQKLQLALESNDAKAVEAFFVEAKQRRDGWSAQAASPSPE